MFAKNLKTINCIICQPGLNNVYVASWRGVQCTWASWWGSWIFHGTINRVTVVITGLYCPQVYSNGWQPGLDVRVIQILYTIEYFWWKIAFWLQDSGYLGLWLLLTNNCHELFMFLLSLEADFLIINLLVLGCTYVDAWFVSSLPFNVLYVMERP